MYAIPLEFVVFLFGACIGSFLNVCIYRLPVSKSIVHPPSSCPGCGTRIKFYDNIPIISWILLRGKCRNCKTGISVRYPMIELMTGLFAVCVLVKFGLTFSAAVYFVFICSLLVITYIDIDHGIIPNEISLPGVPIFFLAAIYMPEITVKSSLLGILCGGGSLYAVAWTYKMITKKDGMGFGDVKLLAMIGALVGVEGIIFTIFIGSAVGTVVGFLVMIQNRTKDLKLAIPFGPFLSVGALVYIFMGQRIISWYLMQFRPY